MRRYLLAVWILAACGDDPPSASPSAAPPSALTAPQPSTTASVDVVTHASERSDGPPVFPEGKALDGNLLRQRHRERLAKDTSAVVALGGDDAQALGQRICEAVVPRRAPGTPVLVKPNIGGFDGFQDPAKHNGDDGVTGRITSPDFVRGVVRCLKERGHTKITVADGWGASHAGWKKLVEVSGYARMAKDEGVPLVCMCDDGVFDAAEGTPGKPVAVTGMEKTNVPSLLLPKILAEHLSGGLFVMVPKLKAHRFSVVSLGIKNLQGVVMSSQAAPAHRQKWRMHAELNDYTGDRTAYVKALELFSKRMVDVLEVAAPDAVLLEGAPAMMGDGFHELVPVDGMIAIGGTNVIRVDQIGAQFLGAWNNQALAKELGGHASSPLILKAAERFDVLFDATKIEGDARERVLEPRPFIYKAIPFRLGAGASPPAGTRPEAHATALGTRTVTLDGKLDEEAWQGAAAIRFVTDWKARASSIVTTVRFLWSSDALYAGFELDSAGSNTDQGKPKDRDRPGLYQEDCVELFLGTDPSTPHRYYEIEIGPHGHFLDLAIDRQKKTEDVGWSSGLSVGTSRDGQRAIIEVALGAAEIRALLAKGARLPLGVYRMEGKGDRSYLAWSPTMTDKPNFHVPAKFGVLILD